MINLMPDDDKKQLRAARTNVRLLNYFLILVVAAAFLLLVLYGSSFLLRQTQTSAEQLILANDTKAEVFNETQSQISDLSGRLTDARSVLDGQSSYGKIVRAIGDRMTAGTVIKELALTPAAIRGESFVVTIYAVSSTATVELRESLEQSGTFSDISIASITESGAIAGYPVSASMTLSLTPGAGR